ncbi:uncharacterized protein LOC121736938 [Aricia agestis]|uniref:uncharacterized protein LOC121736938 n=1 Tax=Aricia agestis TaxID=91739 RepID=UPI001C20295C|nr:uncharacterized protein LOC121736938 [Aricia agestis]
MESGIPNLEIDGIDLSNYVRDPNSYNPIVYIHKRNLKRGMTDDDDIIPKMLDKGQQFDSNDENKDTYDNNITNEDFLDATMKKTTHFAKTLIPITIPPKANDENVYYTIKSSKKSRTENRGCRCNLDDPNLNNIKDSNKKEKIKSKKDFKPKKYLKTTETITQSSETTVPSSDDTHNQTLSELSEFSENKLKESANKRKHDTKIIPSQSFQTLAEENQDVGKIKIQIMNDKERQTFCESICIPLVNAVKDSISADELNKGLLAVQNKVDKFSEKLDNVLERLSRIDEKLSSTVNNTIMVDNQAHKSVEEENTIERDNPKETDCNRKEEPKKVKKLQNRNDLSIQDLEEDEEGRGERVPESLNVSSLVGVAPTPVHRLPARFCWTDTKLNG